MNTSIRSDDLTTAVKSGARLQHLASQLCDWLVQNEAPGNHIRCAEKLVEGTEALVAGLGVLEVTLIDDRSPIDSALAHDFRNRLNFVYQPLQRLERLDVDSTLGSLSSQLAELRDHYQEIASSFQSLRHTEGSQSTKTASEVEGSSPPDSESIRLMKRAEETGRVLIVDDDWKVCQQLEESLEDQGHIATSCRRPERVVDMLCDHAFDICLLDVNMPTMSGWDLLQKIKSDSRTAHTSVIVVSGTDEDESATQAILSGADDFIAKPVNDSLLTARIANCLSRSRQHLRELTKFLPVSVVEVIRKEPHRLQQGHEATVTVMFCDIRRFSRFSERMSPSETIRWISDVMDNLSKRILEDGGTLIDFVGDEVFAMWGAPQPSGNHAELACRCALKLQETVHELSERWAPILGDSMEVGIGIHSGIVSVGNTGSAQRFKYGPLGNTVNLASRVQGASKYLRSKILITRDTRRQIPRDIPARRLCSVKVNNIERPVDLFELATDDSLKAKARDNAYEEALNEFESGSFSNAITKLARMLARHPDDGPSLVLMNRLIEAKLSGSDHFDPVWSLPGK